MKRIIALVLALTTVFSLNICMTTTVSANKEQIVQFEDNFERSNLFWTLSEASIKDGKLNFPDKYSSATTLPSGKRETDADVLTLNNFTLEYDLTLFESTKPSWFMTTLCGYQILHKQKEIKYTAPGSSDENPAAKFTTELGQKYNLKYTVTDKAILAYIKKDSDLNYRELFAIARRSERDSSVKFTSWFVAEVDNVKVYAADNSAKNIINKKIVSVPVGDTHKIEIINPTVNDLKYESLNTAVATVSDDGTVTTIKNGKSLIYVKDSEGNIVESVQVVAYNSVISLSFVMHRNAPETFEVGDVFCLQVESKPSNAPLVLDWSIEGDGILEQYGDSAIDNTFTAIGAGTAVVRVKDRLGVATAFKEIIVNPKKETVMNDTPINFGLTGRKQKISENLLGASNSMGLIGKSDSASLVDLGSRFDFTTMRYMDLLKGEQKDNYKITDLDAWFTNKYPAFWDAVNTGKYLTILCLWPQYHTKEELLAQVKYCKERNQTGKPIYFEYGNEIYAISAEKHFPTAEDYFSKAADFSVALEEIYPESKLLPSIFAQDMETNILADPVNMAQLEGDQAYTQPHRTAEWNKTAIKYKDYFDAFTYHSYSSFHQMGGITPRKNWFDLCAYSQQDYYSCLNLLDRFGDNLTFEVTEWGQLTSEVFYGTGYDAEAKKRHQRGKYPVASMSYLERIMNFAKAGIVETSHYHCLSDKQGFGIIEFSTIDGLDNGEGITTNYYAFEEYGNLLSRNTHMYDLQSINQSYTVSKRPYYWGDDEALNMNDVEVWGLGDESKLNEVVFSNRTNEPKKIKLNGAKLKPTWSYGGSEDIIAPGWMKNEAYTSEFCHVSTLPNAEELLIKPETHPNASFEDEIIIQPLSIMIAQVDGTPEVIEGHSSSKISRISEYRLSHALALKVDNPVAYNDNIKTSIDPENSAVVPVIKNGRTLLPLRFVAESFGCEVSYDEATKGITIQGKDTNISLTVGEKIYVVNGETKEFDVPAEVSDGRTLVPLRALAESLGKDVLWDSRGLIIITNAKTAFHYYDEASGVLDKGWVDESNAKIDEILTLFN